MSKKVIYINIIKKISPEISFKVFFISKVSVNLNKKSFKYVKSGFRDKNSHVKFNKTKKFFKL